MTAPSVVFGAIAKATNWTETGYGKVPGISLDGVQGDDDTRLVLPLCMQYLTPQWVSFFGLVSLNSSYLKEIWRGRQANPTIFLIKCEFRIWSFLLRILSFALLVSSLKFH